MKRKKLIALAVIAVFTAIAITGCFIEFPFTMHPPYYGDDGYRVTAQGVGSAPGWGGPGRPVTVILDLENGIITRARVRGPAETESGANLVREAPRMIEASNDVNMVVAGATVTARAISQAGRAALLDAGAVLED